MEPLRAEERARRRTGETFELTEEVTQKLKQLFNEKLNKDYSGKIFKVELILYGNSDIDIKKIKKDLKEYYRFYGYTYNGVAVQYTKRILHTPVTNLVEAALAI